MSKIAELANAPEVSFIGYLTLDEVKQMVSDWYNEKYKELTGTAPVLGDAAPEKLLLHLDLNAKTCIRPVSMGIEFVGQRVWATHAVLRKSTARRMKREVRKISEDVRDGVITRQEYQRRVASIRGMMDHTNSGALRWRLNEITRNIVGEEYGQLPYGRGDSDRKAVRGGGAAKRDHPRAA